MKDETPLNDSSNLLVARHGEQHNLLLVWINKNSALPDFTAIHEKN